MNKIALPVVIAVLVSACGGGTEEEAGSVRLLTHESFAVSEEVLADFTEQTGYELEVLTGGDAGQIVNQAILAAGNPVADVLFGVDTTFLSRALDGDVFEPYQSDELDGVPARWTADTGGLVAPIDFGDVCINYDKQGLGGLAPPASLADLADPAYRGLLVVENPATSSPGLAFLLATIAHFGEEGDYTWNDFWTDLRANDVAVTRGWEEAYYGSFSGGSGSGVRPLVVSYASSPPAEIVFAAEPLDEAPTGVMTEGCFRQVEYAGILRGTDRPRAAEALIDYMLTTTFQEDIPLQMFVFPVREDAALPDVFVEHTELPDDPMGLDPAAIEQNRERWIEEWTAIVLR